MGKRNVEEFQVPNKRRLKIGKEGERKNNLREQRHSSKFVESPVNSDEEEYQEKVLNMGTHWWNKTDHRFFRNINALDVRNIFQRTTSEDLLQLKYPSRRLASYFQEQLQPLQPALLNPSLLKVLFRREVKLDHYQNYQLAVFSFKEYEESRRSQEVQIDKNLHLSSFRVRSQEEFQLDEGLLERLELKLVELEDRQDVIKRILDFEVRKVEIKEDVERELELWTCELRETNKMNIVNWNQMRTRIVALPTCAVQIQAEVDQIRKELRMTEVLLYFKRGHGDKTEQMLQQALQNLNRKQIGIKQQQRKKRGTKIEQLKCLFETDCKICFCTESNDNNKVVYCDGCNTSFHQACYGVPEIEPEQHFFCEVCLFLKDNTTSDKQNPRSLRKPVCQICFKLNFPMRQLGGHFYHITCLVLFDLVEIINYEIKFKNSLTHEAILGRVVDNEINTSFCAFCLKETGMKFACQQRCGQYFHPICAYLNGVHFELVRHYHSISAHLSCSKHHPHRDSLNQIYLRRFFCDYKNTSNKTDLEFEEVYKKEADDRSNNLSNKKRDIALGVFKKSFNRANKPNRQKGRERSQMQTPSKKDISQISWTPANLGSESEIATQTRRLMKRLSESREC